MSNNQPPGSNVPLYNVGQNPVDLRVQFHMWGIEQNVRSLVSYFTGVERIDRVLVGESYNGGGGQGGASSLVSYLQPPAPPSQSVRGPGANDRPPAQNEQGAMQGMLAHTYRVVLQKGYTFAGLLLGRSARERAGQYRKLTAHSRTFERGAGGPDPTILGHARAF